MIKQPYLKIILLNIFFGIFLIIQLFKVEFIFKLIMTFLRLTDEHKSVFDQYNKKCTVK